MEAAFNRDTIFILYHEYELDGHDTLKILGVYSERILAEAAQARFELEPGFCDYKEGFLIPETQLNRNSGQAALSPTGILARIPNECSHECGCPGPESGTWESNSAQVLQ